MVGDLLELHEPFLAHRMLDNERSKLVALGHTSITLRQERLGGPVERGIDVRSAVAQQRPLEAALRDAGTLGAAADGNGDHVLMPFPETIETGRLILRRWTANDLPAMTAIWSDSDVQAALRPGEQVDPQAVARESLDRRLANWTRDGFGLFAAVERGSGEVIGWSGFWRQDIARALEGEIEVGWTLRRPWWGRGLATEAAQASAEAAFADLDLDRVISLILPENTRSIAVAERLGMKTEGTTPHSENPELALCVYSLSNPKSSVSASPQSFSSR